MIVVSNTTPLRYLIEVDAIHILPALFGSILTTPAVVDELRLPHFPEAVRAWANQLPDWITIAQPRIPLPLSETLHPGEAEAIALAIERNADRLLIDERAGVEFARSRGVHVLRTLTLIALAGEEKLIDARAIIRRLANETRFRATEDLFARYLSFDRDPQIQQAVDTERTALRKPADDPMP